MSCLWYCMRRSTVETRNQGAVKGILRLPDLMVTDPRVRKMLFLIIMEFGVDGDNNHNYVNGHVTHVFGKNTPSQHNHLPVATPLSWYCYHDTLWWNCTGYWVVAGALIKSGKGLFMWILWWSWVWSASLSQIRRAALRYDRALQTVESTYTRCSAHGPGEVYLLYLCGSV